MPQQLIHEQAEQKAAELEAELKSLGRWSAQPLPPEQFENMGAFGSNTMNFTQWLQFVLIPTIHDIAREKGEFPSESMLAPYAVRIFPNDAALDRLHQILYDIDELINSAGQLPKEEDDTPTYPSSEPSPYSLPSELPAVAYTLAELLPQFDGDGLESQLQTFDAFLEAYAPEVRPVIVDLLQKASAAANNPVVSQRIREAAQSVLEGGRAAELYDHDAAMRKYRGL